jgi:hypothetical protein
MTQALNGTVVSEIIDEDKDKRSMSGCLAFQLHAGPPMVVEYKDIRLKRYDNGDAIVLFNGKNLDGWRVVTGGFYGNKGDVKVENGVIKMGIGMPMTGIGWEGALPRDNYEVTLEGRRTDGYDFFCGMTFPVAESYVTLILGGWGGYVVGLSNVDNMNASENETAMGREFEMNEWYRIRVRVTEPKIQVWLDDQKIIDIKRESHKFNVWPEQEPIRPFGISTYDTASELRDIKIRKLSPEEIAEEE